MPREIADPPREEESKIIEEEAIAYVPLSSLETEVISFPENKQFLLILEDSRDQHFPKESSQNEDMKTRAATLKSKLEVDEAASSTTVKVPEYLISQDDPEGRTSSTSPMVIEGTQPTSQERIANDVKKGRRPTSKAATKKATVSSMQNEAGPSGCSPNLETGSDDEPVGHTSSTSPMVIEGTQPTNQEGIANDVKKGKRSALKAATKKATVSTIQNEAGPSGCSPNLETGLDDEPEGHTSSTSPMVIEGTQPTNQEGIANNVKKGKRPALKAETKKATASIQNEAGPSGCSPNLETGLDDEPEGHTTHTSSTSPMVIEGTQPTNQEGIANDIRKGKNPVPARKAATKTATVLSMQNETGPCGCSPNLEETGLDDDPEGHTSSTSPMIFEATQPTSQEGIGNDVSKGKRPARKAATKKATGSSMQNEAGLSGCSPNLETGLDAETPSSSTPVVSNSKKIVKRKPIQSTLLKAVKTTPSASETDLLSQDITEGPLPKKKKLPARSQALEEFKHGSDFNTIRTNPATKSSVSVRSHRNESEPRAEEANLIIPEADYNAESSSLLQSETGGLLIEQLQSFGVRQTRSMKHKLAASLVLPLSVGINEATSSSASISNTEENACNIITNRLSDTAGPINVQSKGFTNKIISLDCSDDEETLASSILENMGSDELHVMINNCLQIEPVIKETGMLESRADIPCTPINFPTVPSSFNFGQIASGGSQDLFDFDTPSNLLPKVANVNPIETVSSPAIFLSTEVIKSNKSSSAVSVLNMQQHKELTNEKPHVGDCEFIGLNNPRKVIEIKGILKRAFNSESDGEASFGSEQHPKKKLCFSNQNEIFEVERANNGKSIPLFSPLNRRPKPLGYSRRVSKFAVSSQIGAIAMGKNPKRMEPIIDASKLSPLKNSRNILGSEAPLDQSSTLSYGTSKLGQNRSDPLRERIKIKPIRNRDAYPSEVEKPLGVTETNSAMLDEWDESEVNLSDVVDPANLFVDSQSFSERAFYEVAYPDLIHCVHPVGPILRKLTAPSMEDTLKAALKRKKIKTIGDLCAITRFEVKELPILSPRYETFQSVMNRFADNRGMEHMSCGKGKGVSHKSLHKTSILQNDEQPNPFSIKTNPTPKNSDNKPKWSPNSIFGSCNDSPVLRSGFQKDSESLIRSSGMFGQQRSKSESDFSLLQIGNSSNSSPKAFNTTVSGTSGIPDLNHNTPDLLNNFSFLNELKDYIKSENPAAHRFVDFIVTDKECASRLLKCAFGKDDVNRSLLLNGELNISRDWIASAISASGNGGCGKELSSILVGILELFQREENNQEGTKNLKDQCQEFLKLLNKPKEPRSRESIMNQVIQDLEELNGMGPELHLSARNAESLRMLGVMTKITENCLSESHKKKLICKTVNSLQSPTAWQ